MNLTTEPSNQLPDSATNPEASLLPRLGLWTTVALVVGGVIGSGIFLKPAQMALQLGSPMLLLGVWIFAGVMTLFGALTNAEIAAMIPQTGGQYIFFQKMYGNLVAFFYGWAMFAVIFTGGVASIAYGFSEYLQHFVVLYRFPPEIERTLVVPLPFIGNIFPLANIGVKILTIAIIGLLTAVNYRSVDAGGAVQNIFTALKILAILALIVFALSAKEGSCSNLVHNAPHHALSPGDNHSPWGLIAACVGALSGAFWAYDGWNNITYIAGEVKEPQRTIPRALWMGLLITTGVYVLINLAYLFVLPIERIAASPLVASETAQAVMGNIGGGFIALAVMISTFGTTNGNILAGARLYYAMARDGMFFRRVGYLHHTFRTPAFSLVAQALWTSVLVISGSFDMLTDMLIFVSWIFYALGAFGVFVLRKKMPQTARPYRVWGYPVIPAVFCIFAFGFVAVTLYNDITSFQSGVSPVITSVLGLVLVAMGLPFYWYFGRQKRAATR